MRSLSDDDARLRGGIGGSEREGEEEVDVVVVEGALFFLGDKAGWPLLEVFTPDVIVEVEFVSPFVLRGVVTGLVGVGGSGRS